MTSDALRLPVRRPTSDRRPPTSDSPRPRFIFYGGKGGVGKTTCAAARAVAEAAGGERVLVISTDPAHSLGDALGVRLSGSPRQVAIPWRIARGRVARSTASHRRRPGSLDAVELDAPSAFARWLKEHRRPLGEILEHGTWLEREDVEALLDLSMPGVDELMGILEIARLASNARMKPRATTARRTASEARSVRRPSSVYDIIVVDTAPTGHTLRLLAAPETVAAVAEVLEGLQQEHRLIREQLARVGRPEASDRLIALLADQARETAASLHDPKRTAFHWVTLPETLSLAESDDAIAVLERRGIRVPEIVVNRVLPDAGACPVCDRRRVDERRVVEAIRRRPGRGRRLRLIPAALREPRGVPALAALGRLMVDGAGPNAGRPVVGQRPSASTSRQSRPALSLPPGAHVVAPEALAALNGASLLFFGGKGGVGKTTVAAATALRLARATPGTRVLLLSTDPAHSVGDVLDNKGHKERHVKGAPGNLDVRELDPQRALASRRAQLEAALDEIASAAGADAFGAGGSQLMDLAPPGIDELFGILSVLDARDAYDVIVIDTAPTGHALRLLEMPETAREWTQVLLRMLLKYRSLVRPGQLAAELVALSKSIRELQSVLRDQVRTRFIVVTRAAEVPRLETERLFRRLRRLKLAAPAIIVNAMTLAPGRCLRCRTTAEDERCEFLALQRGVRRAGRGRRACAIIQTPLSAPPPQGVDTLERWAGNWVVEGLRAARGR